MTYPGQRKPPDTALRKALTIVGGATAAGLLLWCGLCGVVSLATTGDDDEPGVSVSAEPAGDDQVVPSPTPPSPTPALSPSASPTPSPAVSTTVPAPKPTTKKPPAPARTTKAPPPPPPPDDEPDDVYYANCDEARDAGAAPLYRGDPGYRSGLDRDKDGVACE